MSKAAHGHKANSQQVRFFRDSSVVLHVFQASPLKKRLQELIPQRLAEIKEFRSKYDNYEIGTYTLGPV